MPAQRFRLEIAGKTMVGLAFATEAELDALRKLAADLAVDIPPEDA